MSDVMFFHWFLILIVDAGFYIQFTHSQLLIVKKTSKEMHAIVLFYLDLSYFNRYPD